MSKNKIKFQKVLKKFSIIEKVIYLFAESYNR